MPNTLQYAHGENVSDTLSSSIGSSDLTIPVNAISKWNLSGSGGAAIIDRGTSAQEIVICTGVSGSSLVVASGGRGAYGTSAVGHNSGATIESVPFAHDWNNVISTLVNLFKATDGNIDITKLGTALYVADTGAANAYVATLVPTLASYTAGTIVAFKAANANTTASTLNVNGLGAKTIKKLDGATDLVANDIKSGQIVVAQYDGTNFQMLSPVANTVIAPGTDGWTSDTNTWTYVSATSFKVSGKNVTSQFVKGTRIKCTNNSSTFYGTVISSSFSTDTTITLATNADYSLNNSAITAPYYSYEASPQGYPGAFNWTPAYSTDGSAFTNAPSSTQAYFTIIGNVVTIFNKFTCNATSGGTGNILITGFPATPAQNFLSGWGADLSSSVTLVVQILNSPVEFVVAKYDGTTIIANSHKLAVGAVYTI